MNWGAGLGLVALGWSLGANSWLAGFLAGCGGALFVLTCVSYARGKGRASAWGATCGVASVAGALLLVRGIAPPFAAALAALGLLALVLVPGRRRATTPA